MNNQTSIQQWMLAWSMMTGQIGQATTFFNKKKHRQALEGYRKDFLLDDYPSASEDQKNAIHAQWEQFAHMLISSCAKSRSYGSTLFGIVPMKESGVYTKLAEEIEMVCCTYPKKFGMQKAFEPLYLCMQDVLNTYIDRPLE